MTLDVALLVLRIAIVIALYAFLAALLLFIWQDVRAVSRQIGAGQRAAARLVVVECGDLPLEVGHEYPLQPVTTLGRGPTNSIVLPEPFASTDHALIVLRRGQWWLEDRQSRNGTLLNGVPINEPVVLTSGDVISIGRINLRFETP